MSRDRRTKPETRLFGSYYVLLSSTDLSNFLRL